MTSPYKSLKIENFGHLKKVIISNPKRKNALSLEAYSELTGKLENMSKISCFLLIKIGHVI